MATTPLKPLKHFPGRSASSLNKLTASMLVAGLSMAHAETVDIRPTLTITSSAVKQVNIQGTPSDGNKATHELVTVVSPGLQFAVHGANTLIDGLIHLDSYQYARGTQDTQTVPNGRLLGQVFSREAGTGVEAAWQAQQVPKQFIANTGSSPSPNNDITQTDWRIAPYLNKQLNADTSVKAKLERRETQSHQINPTPPTLPKSNATTGTASVEQRAIPFGYELSYRRQRTRTSQDVTVDAAATELSQTYSETTTYAKGLYALSPELEIGLLLGRESFDLKSDHVSDFIQNDPYRGRLYGWSFNWRPQERTSLTAQFEKHASDNSDHFLGQTWQVDASHRMTWLAFGATFSRHATPPIQPDPSKVLTDINALIGAVTPLANGKVSYSLAAQLRQEASGRIAFIGRRDTITLSAGRTDTSPLTQKQELLPTASITRDYFFLAEWTHRLAPTWKLSNNLKWTRTNLTSLTAVGPFAGTSFVFGREFYWSGSVIKDLSPSAVATLGVRRKIVHTEPLYGEGSETAAFAGLDYKF